MSTLERALRFSSPHGRMDILRRLRPLGWPWLERDSDRLGPYLSAMVAEGVFVRLYDLDGYDSNGPTYTLAVRLDRGVHEPPDLATGLEACLRAIDASGVVADEGLD
jgi:hypothetical protein